MGTDELLGRTFGKYRLIREIGSGAMGTVYEARHEILGQRAAVKILEAHLTNDAAYVRRFEREGRTIAKLRHSHIVSVYDLGHEDHVHYLAMEYIQGKTLEDLLKRKGALETRRALDFTRQVADALDEAHRNKIVHRDIKPANIMVNRMGKVKVMDFGIAKGHERPGGASVLKAQIGTPRYMSPEQCMGRDLDGRTDIYSLGVVLFEMLTDRSPYPLHISSLSQLTDIVINHPFPSPRIAGREVSESVQRILTKMTAKDSEERYASSRQVAEDILACMRTKDYVTDADATDDGEGLAEAVRHRRKRWWALSPKNTSRAYAPRWRGDARTVRPPKNSKPSVRSRRSQSGWAKNSAAF